MTRTEMFEQFLIYQRLGNRKNAKQTWRSLARQITGLNKDQVWKVVHEGIEEGRIKEYKRRNRSYHVLALTDEGREFLAEIRVALFACPPKEHELCEEELQEKLETGISACRAALAALTDVPIEVSGDQRGQRWKAQWLVYAEYLIDRVQQGLSVHRQRLLENEPIDESVLGSSISSAETAVPLPTEGE